MTNPADNFTEVIKSIQANDTNRAKSEGPNPEGVANKLRRERDEAREEREVFRTELEACKKVEAAEWLLLSEVVDAIRGREEESTTSAAIRLDRDTMEKILALWINARGGVLGDALEDFGDLLPEEWRVTPL